MNIIHIVPAANHAFYASQNQQMVMALTHLVETDEEYACWMHNYRGYKILDNSLIELGGALEIERVWEAAQRIDADEIILPDVFLDGERTLRAVDASLERLVHLDSHFNTNSGIRYMAVCQGVDVREFEQTYRKLESYGEIEVIGIPKVCAKLHPAGRPAFQHLWQHSAQTIHLLGLWYSWSEVFSLDTERIRSMDSCMLAFQSRYNLDATAVRPDGYTLDLGTTAVSTKDLCKRADALQDLLELGRTIRR